MVNTKEGRTEQGRTKAMFPFNSVITSALRDGFTEASELPPHVQVYVDLVTTGNVLIHEVSEKHSWIIIEGTCVLEKAPCKPPRYENWKDQILDAFHVVTNPSFVSQEIGQLDVVDNDIAKRWVGNPLITPPLHQTRRFSLQAVLGLMDKYVSPYAIEQMATYPKWRARTCLMMVTRRYDDVIVTTRGRHRYSGNITFFTSHTCYWDVTFQGWPHTIYSNEHEASYHKRCKLTSATALLSKFSHEDWELWSWIQDFDTLVSYSTPKVYLSSPQHIQRVDKMIALFQRRFRVFTYDVVLSEV